MTKITINDRQNIEENINGGDCVLLGSMDEQLLALIQMVMSMFEEMGYLEDQEK